MPAGSCCGRTEPDDNNDDDDVLNSTNLTQNIVPTRPSTRKRSTSNTSQTRNPLLAGASSADTPPDIVQPPVDMSAPASAELVGKLKRYIGGWKKGQTCMFVKTGTYLEEYGEKDNINVKLPSIVYDLSHAQIADTDKPEAFSLKTRNGSNVILQATTIDERQKWISAINSANAQSEFAGGTAGGHRDRKSFAAALIAPIRRRHMSMSLSLGRKGLPKTSPNGGRHARRDEPFRIVGTLRVHVMEGDGIGGRSAKKKPSPYAVVLVDSVLRACSTTKTATSNPFWAEEYFFDTNITHESSMVTILINDCDQKDQPNNCRLGKVLVDLNPLRHGRPNDQWYTVFAPDKAPPPAKGKKQDLFAHGRSNSVDGAAATVNDIGHGIVRLKITFTLEKIMPFSEYRELLELIIDPELTVAEALAKVATTQLDEVAGTLVNIFALNNRVTNFVRTLTDLEIRKTDRAAIIFRGNTLGTKVIDMYMKMVGMDYLQETLMEVMRNVAADRDSVEIDPTRMEKGEDPKKNQRRLVYHCECVFRQIEKSVEKCPQEMKRVFANIRNEVVRKFKDGDEKYTAVSGFIFLRFFCPAILNPTLFGIVPEQLTGRPARAVTLVAKTLQSLANLAPSVEKEPYMVAMAPFVEENMPTMKKLIEQFSTPVSNEDFDNVNEFLDDRDLSRELSALQRHCVEKFADLKKASEAKKDDTLEQLFPVLTRLEQRQFEFEKQYAMEFAQKLAQQQDRAGPSNPRLRTIMESD